MPRKPEYTGISLNSELVKAVEEFIQKNPTKGYRSLTRFVEEATRKRLEELNNQLKTLPRFDRLNGDATGVLLYDREMEDVKTVHVSIKPSGIQCDFHLRDDCEHVKYALILSDVQNMIKKRRKEGWKIEVPEEQGGGELK
jgi:metal-responsive CopG/Arc/MetJ family transcriptional regulator